MSFENMDVGSGSETASAPLGQISFDDIEHVVEKVEAEEKAEAKAEKQEISKVAEKVAEKVAKKLDEKDEASIQDAAPSTSQDGQKPKPVKAYDGDKEVDLNPDLEIEYKVDGKIEKMKLADVRNEISGKTNWDRKNNDFFQQKKRFEDQVKYVNEQVDSILKMAQEKPEAALFELARLAGKSPEEYSKMLAGTMEGATRWQDMSDAERRAVMAEAENVGHRSEIERRKNMEERAKSEEARTSSINSLAKELELSDDDISGFASDIQKHAQIANPSAEHIYTAWVFKNTMEAFNSHASDALKANPSLFGEASQVLLSNGIRNKADIEQIIKQAYGEEDSARKVGKKISSQAPKTASAATSSQKKLEVVSFDDI
jgi:predicted Fe-S protein YdhL (DUF1289 family)